MRYHHLFFDMDNTLLDFDADEDQALERLFTAQDVVLTAELKQDYQTFNQGLWRQYERGELTREILLNTRFATFFKQALGKTVDGHALSDLYLRNLALGHDLMPQAESLLEQLKTTDAKLYITTNGVASTQYQRLDDAGLTPYFEAIFVSEELGYQKPDPHYFQTVLQRLGNVPQADALVVGDSLTSDVQGGQNVGLATAWYNPKQHVNQDPALKPTHEIQTLTELLTL